MKLVDTFERQLRDDFESFKSIWRNLNKQQKGDVIVWDRKEFQVEEIKELPDKEAEKYPGEKYYTVCRIEPAGGIKLKVLCHKIRAKENELKTK